MDNQTTDLKEEKPVVQLPNDPPSPLFQEQQRIENIFGTLIRVTTAPTWVPRSFYEGFAADTTNDRLYWYDFVDAVWNSADTLPSQSGNSGKYLQTDGSTLFWASPYPVGYVDKGSQNSSVTFDIANSNKQKVTLTGGPVTLSLSNVSVGVVILLSIIQDGTGGRTVTWFSGISWPGGVTPTLTTTANKTDVFGFLCTASNTYYGFILGQNI